MVVMGMSLSPPPHHHRPSSLTVDHWWRVLRLIFKLLAVLSQFAENFSYISQDCTERVYTLLVNSAKVQKWLPQGLSP